MPLANEYQVMFEQLAAAGPAPSVRDLPVADGRELYRAARAVNPDLPIHKISDATLPGPDGAIPIRIYQPQGDGPFGVLVYFLGGGWVIGDLDTADAVCREIATLAELVVVSVDYRLAPEHVYPAAVEDSYAALSGYTRIFKRTGQWQDQHVCGERWRQFSCSDCATKPRPRGPTHRFSMSTLPCDETPGMGRPSLQ